MSEPDPSSLVVEKIQNKDFEGNDVFDDLSLLAAKTGLSSTNIAKLLAAVAGSTLSLAQKAKLLRKCMIPKPQSYLPHDLYLKVLGCVGAPELYFKNGKQHKSKRLPLSLQQKLLQWLICVLPYFGEQVYSYTRQSLPLLLGLLSFEFSRPFITTLMIVGTSRQSSLQTKQKVLRPWHIQMVTDLHIRFPQDEALILLLHHFAKIDLQLDLRHYLKTSILPRLVNSSNLIGYSDLPVLHEARRVRQGSTNHFSVAISAVDSELGRLFDSFEPSSKRRKLDSISGAAEDFIIPSVEDNAVPISTISSVTALAKNFERIRFMNPSSVLCEARSKNTGIKCLYTSLRLLDTNSSDPFYKKLLFALKYHALGDEPPSSMFALEKLIELSRYDGLAKYSELIFHFMDSHIRSQVTLRQKVQLLRFAILDVLNLKPILEGISSQITSLYASDPKEATSTTMSFLYNASIGIKKLILLDVNGTRIASMKTFTSVIFDLISENWPRLHLSVKMAFLGYLRIVQSALNGESTIGNFEFLILPIPLFYRLICSSNPLVVSEALGYARFLKKLKLAPDAPAQIIKNAFIMDSANFFWRDRAFRVEEGTAGSGMFLDTHFLGKLGRINYYSNSSLVSLRSTGNIIQNPCFAYICAELVWKLEDSSSEINCRHPGPLCESTIERLQRDPDVIWLPMTYGDIRLKVLRDLDDMGFTGLGDFLFTSIRSLANVTRSSK